MHGMPTQDNSIMYKLSLIKQAHINQWKVNSFTLMLVITLFGVLILGMKLIRDLVLVVLMDLLEHLGNKFQEEWHGYHLQKKESYGLSILKAKLGFLKLVLLQPGNTLITFQMVGPLLKTMKVILLSKLILATILNL